MIYLSGFEYVLLCIVSTLALLAHAVFPAERNDVWQQGAWTCSMLGWGFISVRLWLAVTELDRSITAQGAIGLALLAAGAIIRRVSKEAR